MKPSLTPMLLCAALACALAPGLAAQTTTTPPEQTNGGFRTLIGPPQRSATSDFPTSFKNWVNTDRVAFSDSNKPGTLKINDAFSHVEIQGVAGDKVSAGSPLALKTLDGPGVPAGFELVEKNNVVTLNVSGDSKESYKFDFKIQVPRNTNIVIENNLSQGVRHVTIADTDGDVDINLRSGNIALKNTAGAITVNLTSYGAIVAELGKAPQKPVKLATTIHNIDLILPADTAANVFMGTQYGSARTNFSEAAFRIVMNPAAIASGNEALSKVQQAWEKTIREDIAKRRQEQGDDTTVWPVVESARLDAIRGEIARRRQQRGDDAPMPASASFRSGGKTITGELNGGGVDIRLITLSGTITLKQAK